MTQSMVLVGGGIGGLAAALACGRSGLFGDSGQGLRLLEQARAFGELGAGVQLGPNVTRLLEGWGLQQELAKYASFPDQLEVKDALAGRLIAKLPLGLAMRARYGAPYATLARQDLHAMLLRAVQGLGGVEIALNTRVVNASVTKNQVLVRTQDCREFSASCVIGADGVWSPLRGQVVGDGAPRVTGHLAYRAMVSQSQLPSAIRSQTVTVWLGPQFHAVQYPVRGGEWLNVVVILRGSVSGDPSAWDHAANAGELRARLANVGSGLIDLLHAIDNWRLWALSDRSPMRGPREMAVGRLALLGDAAHPMRPYLAQGAGMAIEDAAQLSRSLEVCRGDIDVGLSHYASARWRRNARVQTRALRNGKIFHLQGPLRLARDIGLTLLGPRLLDMPWLYGHGQAVGEF
jgi:salicylate hydroxylase